MYQYIQLNYVSQLKDSHVRYIQESDHLLDNVYQSDECVILLIELILYRLSCYLRIFVMLSKIYHLFHVIY